MNENWKDAALGWQKLSQEQEKQVNELLRQTDSLTKEAKHYKDLWEKSYTTTDRLSKYDLERQLRKLTEQNKKLSGQNVKLMEQNTTLGGCAERAQKALEEAGVVKYGASSETSWKAQYEAEKRLREETEILRDAWEAQYNELTRDLEETANRIVDESLSEKLEKVEKLEKHWNELLEKLRGR